MKTCAFLLLAALAGALASAADRTLSGRVVDAATGEPIARAHITVRFYQAAQPAPEVTLLTDTDGAFQLTNLPTGGFMVMCEKAGYLPASQGASGTPAPNSDGTATSTMVVKLTAQAAIEGTVVDDKDMPVENAFIQAVRQQVVNGRRQLQGFGGGSTDGTGYFRIYGLTAGRYYLSIGARLSGARRTKPLAYPQLYYPNATDIAAAQPIDLKAGDEGQIKIRLPEPVPAFQVRGVVAGAAQNMSVALIRQPSSQMFQGSSGDLDWDPKTRVFRFSHVTSGIYLVTASVHDGKNSLQASTTVTVGSTDVAGIRLEPVESGVDGTVRTDGDGPPIRPFVSLQSGAMGNGAPVDGDGKFHIPNIMAGTYQVTVQNGPQWCVRSILQGGRDVSEGLTITPGVAPDPVEISLTSHCGSIDVTVTPPDSGLPPNVFVYLLRKAGSEFRLERQGFLSGTGRDSALHTALQGVPAGDYMVYAWPQEAQIEYSNASYMRQFESFGQAVTVTEDTKASVTIDKVLLSTAKN